MVQGQHCRYLYMTLLHYTLNQQVSDSDSEQLSTGQKLMSWLSIFCIISILTS